jgi:Na+-driven multidrug efflux pump
MAVISGLLGAVIGIAVSRAVLSAMGNYGNLLDLAVRYCIIYFAGVPFISLTNYLIAIFRAKGDAKTPLIVLSLSGVANVGLNLFFVLVVKLSVEGVAIATVAANALSAVILLIKLRKDQDYTTFSFKRLKINFTAMKEIILIGLPAGIQGALFSISNMLIQSSIVSVNNKLASADNVYQPIVNGNAAAGNLEGFMYTTMNAVYQGVVTFTSQNIGAKKPHRTKRIMYSGFLLTTIIYVVMATFMFSLKPFLLGLYGIKDGEAGSLEALAMYAATTKMKYLMLTYFFLGCMEITTGVLRGLGKSLTSTFITLIGACLFRVLWISFIFPLKETLEVIFVSYPISWFLTALTSFIVIQVLVRKMVRKRREEEINE